MRNFRWWMPVVLALLCAAAYYNTFHVPFLFDDLPAILHNPAIRHFWPLSAVITTRFPGLSGRPLISLSLAFNYALGGYDVAGYHLLNLVVHFLNTLLVFAIVYHTQSRPQSSQISHDRALWLAFTIAGLWMLHPLVTESVTYVLQRTESLAGMFLLLTLYCFIRGIESSRTTRWFGLAILAAILGVGTKEIVVVAPLLVLVWDYIFVSGSLQTGLRQRRGLYAGLAASWAVLTALLLPANLKSKFGLDAGLMTPWAYFKMQWVVLTHYLRLVLWPQGLVLDYSDWPQDTPVVILLPALGLLLGLFAGSLWGIRRRRWWGFWGAWFFLLLAPTSSLLPLPFEPATERRMYLPLVAVIAVVLGGGDHLCRNLWTRFRWPDRVRTWLQVALVMGLALALGTATIQRNAQYHSAESIWADVVTKRPDDLRGHANLGLALLDDGRAEESIPHFTNSLRIDPTQPIVRCNLAIALARSGVTNQSLAELQETLREAPDFALAHVSLADILASQGNQQAALEQYTVGIALNPNDQAAHFNLAQLFMRLGQREHAVSQYLEVVQLDPRDAPAHYNLANLLVESGHEAEAISHYAAAARLDPRNARSQINLGNLFLKLGRADDAIAAYTDALRADPTAFKAHNNLAVILANRGDLVHAAEHLREAVRLNPDAPEVHSELAEVLDRQGLHEEARRQLAEAQRLRETSGPH